MKLTVKTVVFLALGGVLFSCGPQSDIEKLKEKRAKLKTQVAALDEEIRSLDTTKTRLLPLVRPGEVKIGGFKHQVIVQGEVQTDQEVTINAEANGQIKSINVTEGQKVKKGHVLARIDTEILSSNVQEVKTQLDFAEYNYEKQKELFDRGVGTEFELEQASNQLNTLKSQLNTLQTQRSKSVVKAPFDGVIDEIFSNEGEMAGMQSPLMRIVNNKEVRISANISEHYYTKIKEGTPAKAYIPTLNDTLDLTINSIGNYIHPTNRTFRVQANVKDNKVLLPNMLAELHVTDLKIDTAVIVPTEAILKSQKNEDYVFVLKEKEDGFAVEKVIVKVISKHKDEAAIEPISRKLQNGEKVVTEGGRGITDQDIVRTF
ncbi:MAG: efflux RND transporter periplasmic adaptor subunit [Brumimicrobium sp.]